MLALLALTLVAGPARAQSCTECDKPPVSDVQVGQGGPSGSGTAGCEIIDPEVHQGPAPGLDVMVWQRIFDDLGQDAVKDINEGWIRALDPATGEFATGSVATFFSSDVSKYSASQAGPKFANGKNASGVAEVYVVFSRRPGSGDDDINPAPPRRSVEFRKYVTGGGCNLLSAPDLCFTTSAQIPAAAPPPPFSPPACIIRAITYTTEEEEFLTQFSFPAKAVYFYKEVPGPSPCGSVSQLRWATLSTWLSGGTPGCTSADETCYLNDTAPWGRINKIGTDLWVVTTTSDAGGVAQATLVKVDDPTQVQIVTGDADTTHSTFDPFWRYLKWNPIAWLDPQTGTYMLAMRQNDPASEDHSSIAVWQQQANGTWKLHTAFDGLSIGEGSTLGASLSPEPFVWDGRSYIVFSTANTIPIGSANDGNIWVARINSTNPKVDWSRQVNTRPTTPYDKAVRRRVEGEVYFLRNGATLLRPVIYYSMLEIPGEDTDEPCDYTTSPPQGYENSTLRRAEVCPPGVTGTPCT